MSKRWAPSTKSHVWSKTKGRCWYCGCEIDPFTFQIDHVIPKTVGGTNERSNLVPSCRSCNMSKGNRDMDDLRWKMYWKAMGAPQYTREQIAFLERRFGLEVNHLAFKFWFEIQGIEP